VKRRGILSILVAVGLVAVLLVFLVAFQVRVNERALVLTFGEVTRSIEKPGLYFKLPYPIQTVQKFDTRMRVIESKFQEVYTADGINLIVTLAVGWSIDQPATFYNSLQVPANAQSQLEHLVGGEMNGVVGRHRFEQFVSTDPKQLAFDKIEDDIVGDEADEASVKAIAETRYGIRIRFVRITQLGLPEAVTEKVFARMKAERNRIATAARAVGKSQADQIKAKADYDAELVRSEAEAEATRLRGQGDAAAAEAYKVFDKNQGLAIYLSKLDAIRKLKDRLTVILDTRNPPWDLLRGDVKSILDRHKRLAPLPETPREEGNR
jgi:membrane protease subunit HflC